MRGAIVAIALGGLFCASCAGGSSRGEAGLTEGKGSSAAAVADVSPVAVSTGARRPPPPGVKAVGYGDHGWEKAATDASTTVKLQVYPADIYLDQYLQVYAGVTFTGAYKATQVDFGDGAVVSGPDAMAGLGCYTPARSYEDRWLVNGPWHRYAAPGTYTVTVTVSVVDCKQPPPGPVDPATERPRYGNETSVSVSLPVLVWPEKTPKPA